jgi:hypothetical protein
MAAARALAVAFLLVVAGSGFSVSGAEELTDTSSSSSTVLTTVCNKRKLRVRWPRPVMAWMAHGGTAARSFAFSFLCLPQ